MANKELQNLLNNLKVYFAGELISSHELVKALEVFMNRHNSNDDKNVNMILHTGSLIYDIIAIVYAVFSNIAFDEQTVESIQESFKPGDFVIYTDNKNKTGKYKYEGKDIRNNLNYIKLIMDKDGTIIFLPEAEWAKLAPYKGTSKILSNQGIRSKKNACFIKEIEKFLNKIIPAITSTSSVFVTSKKQAELLAKNITFSLNGVSAKLMDIAAIAYYTDLDNSYQIGINPLKCEANIQFTSKISVAKKLLKKEGNKKIIFFISDKTLIKRFYSELPGILQSNRKDLQSKYILQTIDSEIAIDILENFENINLFACTKKILTPYSEKLQKTTQMRSSSNIYINELNNQILLIVNHKNEKRLMSGLIKTEDYKKFKENLRIIKKSDYDSPEKNNFIVQSYSLFNLFNTAIFPINELDEYISNNSEIKVQTISKRFEEIEFAQSHFPKHLKDKSLYNIELLKQMYNSIKMEISSKGNELRKIINQYTNKKTAVIVPKAYFSKILADQFMQHNIDFSTANKFNNKQLYDIVISLGNIEGSNFNAFNFKLAKNTITLLYDYEEKLYVAKERKWGKIEKLYNKLSESPLKHSEIFQEFRRTEKEDREEIEEEIDIENFVKEYSFGFAQSIDYKYDYSENNKIFISDVVCIASFSNGEKAFFSKNYKPYIFDSNSEEVTEIEITELSEGDSVIFTNKNAKTSDVVEEILQNLIIENKLTETEKIAIQKSKVWKTKLIQYKKMRSLKANMLARMLSTVEMPVQELTIRQWLTPESRTVGPREANSIKQIGILIDDKNLSENYLQYFEACKTTRKIRRKILKDVAAAIILKFSGKTPAPNNPVYNVFGKLDLLAEILQVDSVFFCKKQVPANLVNKPLRFNE